MNGSYNHLRAFVTRLSALFGETYQPQYLDEASYQEIISADPPGGRRGRGW